MKKTISLLLAAMMMLGSLCVFAEDGIAPLIDCDHDPIYGANPKTTRTQIDTCTTKVTTKYYCNECGTCIDTEISYVYNHTWVDEIIDGKVVEACYYCGAIK